MTMRFARSKFAFALLACFAVLLLCASPASAQVATATVSGTATDPSGAALVGANVQATNTATNEVLKTESDSEGRYRIASLPVGTYNVQASLTGFQTVVRSGVILAVGSSVIVDFSLPVGQVTTTVEVATEVSRVETETSEVSTLVAPRQMRELPLNGRNFEQLLSLAPGVVTVPASMSLGNFVVGRMYGAMDNYSVAGSRPTGQMFLLDGVDIRDFWEHATGSGYAGTSLGVEAIGEFQVLSNTYNAQFAGNGVTLNATSRSGTNDWHGGAYEFLRNSALDARSQTDKLGGLKSPPPFRRNQFGGAIGGPVKKDKLFFFANYEGMRQGLTTTNAFQAFPMGYARNGELPCSLMPTASTCGAGPYSGAPGSATNPIAAVPPFDGSALAASNVTRMANILKIYNLCTTCSAIQTASNGSPNASDLGGYYYGTDKSILNVNEDYLMGRVDYTLSSKDSVFGRFTFDNAHVDDPRDPMQIFPEVDHTRNQFLTITEKHIVSSTMVNSLRFGFTRTKEASASQFHLTSAQLSKLGLAYDPLYLAGPNGANYPGIERTDANVALAGFAGPALGPDLDRPDTLIQNKFSGGDDVVWTHGAHSVKIGGVVQRIQTNNNQLNYAVGGAPSFTTPLALLQGQAYGGYFVPPGFGTSTRYFREIGLAPYIQDDWKISSKLTLNLGIRYDYFTNPVGWAPGGASLTTVVGSFLAPSGPQAFAPTCAGYPTQTLTQLATCQLSIFTPVKHVFASNPNAANWAPRFGFAYDVFKDHKTSVRGGFSLLHDPVAARIYESGFVFTPPAASYNDNRSLGPNNGPCLPDAFAVSAGYCGYTNIAPGEFAAVSYQQPSGSPYLMQYNLGVQHQIANGTVLSVSYVGSLGRHEWMQRDENPPRCSTFPDCSAVPAPTAAGANTGACFSVACAAGYTGQLINPNFGSRVMEAPTSASSYSSLQVSLNRQFSRNIAGQVNYSWSHCIDNGSFATSLEQWAQLQTDAYNQRYDYGNCNYDIRHNLVGNVLYSLPFKGNRLVQGWQFSSIVSLNSGTPLNPTNFTFTGPAGDVSGLSPQWWTRMNYTFAPGCSPNHMIKQWQPDGYFKVFDPSCYTVQAPGRLGNVIRNSIPGVGMINVDFSVLKNTKITEKLNAQFRAEFFNIANHFNPSGPGTNQLNFPGFFGPAYALGTTTSIAGNPRQLQFAVKLDF